MYKFIVCTAMLVSIISTSMANELPLVTPLSVIERSSHSLVVHKRDSLRSARVKFNEAVLTKLAESSSKSKKDSVRSKLKVAAFEHVTIKAFDDVSFAVELQETTKHANGAYSIRGKTLDSELSNVSIVKSDDEFIINIDDAGKAISYRISGVNGSGIVKEVKRTGVVCGVHNEANFERANLSNILAHTHPQLSVAKNRAVKSGQNINIDILLVYNNDAKKWVSQQNMSLQTHALAVQAHLNMASANSLLDVKFRVLKHIAVNESSDDFLVTLYEMSGEKVNYENLSKTSYTITDLPSNNRPLFDHLNAERNQIGADLVAYLAMPEGDGRATGIANLLTKKNPTSWDSDNNYNSVSMIDDALGTTLIHEIGHNFGAGHSIRQNGPNEDIGTYAAGAYVLSEHQVDLENGYYIPYDGYHTIMAYNFYQEGSSQYFFNGSKLLFSSPNLTINSNTAGDANTADNRRVILETAPDISEYRACVQNCESNPQDDPVDPEEENQHVLFADGFE